MGEIYVIEDYLTNKLEELKEEEQILNYFVKNGNEEMVAELLEVLEEIIHISCKLDNMGSNK